MNGESKTADTYCGLEEHTHTEECYDNQGALVCELEEHTHTSECYVEPTATKADAGATSEGADAGVADAGASAADVGADAAASAEGASGADASASDEATDSSASIDTPTGYAGDGTNYVTVNSAAPVSSFYLWIYKNTTGGDSNKVVGFSGWDTADGSSNFGSTGITDAYTYTDSDSGETYYLIPISYFTNVKDSLTGFTFDSQSPGACPFVYAPSASSSTENLTDAAYVKYGENWYVRVQDTGTYTNPDYPRSNVYYNPSNSFTLTYGSTALTVNIVDTDGNPLYGDYSTFSQTLEAAKKYVLGKEPASVDETAAQKMDLPSISGYTYDYAYCNDMKSFTIVSLATAGYSYESVINSAPIGDFRAYNSEPIVSGGWYSSISSITLVYSVATTSFFTMTYGDTTITFNLVDEDGNPLYAVCDNLAAQDGMRYIFGSPSVESHEENERGTNKDKLVWNIAPSVSGYAYHSAYIGENKEDLVCSIATAGYEDTLDNSGTIDHLRFYSTEGITSGNYIDAEAGSYTVTLVYKTAVDSFALTLKDNDGNTLGTITVHVIDLSGNAIEGDYEAYNQELKVNTKYLFDPDASETGAIQLNIPQYLSDSGSDYAYYQTRYDKNNGYQVVSVVTQGYTLGADQGTLGRAFRFYNPGGTDDNKKYHTCDSANIYLVYSAPMHVVTEVANANSTAVNLFDYWKTSQGAIDYPDSDETTGINANHELTFHFSSTDNTKTMNKWTGRSGGVLQGIVSSTLSSGFPALSGNADLGINSTESLAYLFDPNVTVPEVVGEDGTQYKASYRNVQGLFQIDSSGYYYYDSTENFAEFDEDTDRFTLYEEAGVADSDTNGQGMFFPFNTIQEAYPLSSGESATLNHYFGMALTTRFIQNYEGYTDSSRTVPTTFEFSGDDDVWIFIDDVLVADLGGIHDAASVEINFAEGTVEISNVYDGESGTNKVTTYFSDIFANTDVELKPYTQTASDGTETTYTTLENGTTHTLKFFYLERGNAASNLQLKYNLTEVPDTSIYKVDQYGYPLEGATFAVYPSDENSQYAVTTTNTNTDTDTDTVVETEGNDDSTGDTNEKTTTEYVSLAECTQVYSADSVEAGEYYIDPTTGIITAKVGDQTYTITPAYLGTTDAQGEMAFVDNDGMPYSTAELKGMFGDYFILREVGVPDGYRTVEDEILLKFEGELLQSVDPYGTGVWASPNALVTATNTLHVADDYGNTNDSLKTGAKINYYDPTTGTTNGTLFAVVLKRNTGDQSEIKTEDVPTWLPVYGSDEEGYEVLSFGSNDDGYDSQLAAVIAAAKLADKYGNVEFGYAASGMQVLLKNLPGEATRYYTYMLNNDLEFTKTDPQYLIAYYYTTADNLDGANTTNTVRIRSHGQTSTDGSATTTTYDAFTLQWGADIEVPNIENRLFFQKQDTSDSNVFIDNAVFALYPVVEGNLSGENDPNTATTANYYYTATASDGTEAYVRLDVDSEGNTSYGSALVYTTSGGDPTAGTYTIQSGSTQSGGYITDSGAGNITVTTSDNETYTITPATNAAGTSMVGYTHDNCDFVSEDGTGHFRQLMNGTYILREIEAPTGYEVNPEEIKVLVDDTSVYANAGTTDNGVAVGNGVGYVTRTLDVFAAEGTIDESLTWVYSMLRVNPDNDSFAGVSVENTAQYVKQDGDEANGYGSDVTTERSQAMVTYLKYVGSEDDSSLFDYAVNNGSGGQDARYSTDEKGNKTLITQAGEDTLRLYTTAGWSGLAVFQDYAYGSAQTSTNAGEETENATTNYSDLSGRDLTNLFSNSTFVRVTDQYSTGNLEISKTVLPANSTQEFSFTLTFSKGDDMITTLADSYKYTVYDVTYDANGVETGRKKATNTDGTEITGTITINTEKDGNGNITSQTGTATITLKDNQVVVIKDLPYGTEYSVEEAFTTPYTTWVTVNGETSTEDRETEGTLLWTEELNENNVWRVDYTNALVPLVELIKVDGSSNGTITLAGAEFVMYRVVDKTDESGTEVKDTDGNIVSVTQYYSSSDGKWCELASGESESDYAMTTGDNGELMVANMNKAGTYYLKELVAPNGYNLLTKEIEFTVTYDETNKKLKIESPTTASSIYGTPTLTDDAQQLEMTVYNTAGYELPKTGSTGTLPLALGGVALAIVSMVCGYKLSRRDNGDVA